jgi:hypothetical protein
MAKAGNEDEEDEMNEEPKECRKREYTTRQANQEKKKGRV